MTLFLDLTPQQQAQLERAAAQRGLSPAEYLRRLIEQAPQEGGPVDLRSRGIGKAQAADLRARLRTLAEDWERPEMDAYDAL